MADVEKLDVRVGTVREVLGVPGSDKLMRLVVDFGDHRRSILAGIKKERPDPLVSGAEADYFPAGEEVVKGNLVALAARRPSGRLHFPALFDRPARARRRVRPA